MSLLDNARRYLDKIPPAISGAGGHNQTFRVACVLVQGFGLTIGQARPLMIEYSQRCQPPWSESEIDHKLADAEKADEPRGRGYLAQNVAVESLPSLVRAPAAVTRLTSREPLTSSEARTQPIRQPVGKSAVALPTPIPDSARQLLRAAFSPGEGVRICIARTNEENREVPKDAGITLSREEWLAKLDTAAGDPNQILRTPDRNGIFVSINPLKIGGSRDADVTAFRHCLLEFDEISPDEQWNLITQSNIPVTALIHSGKRSLHAWVRVDARDRAEYDQRVRTLYAHFAEYKPDAKNKNPSRFSRLPNCVRFDSRQELLALNIGAESFTAWQIAQEADRLGEEIQIKNLLEFVPSEDPGNVLGQRWLCRGGSCLFIGQSGIGKSSLAMQLAILWALERPAFGICPAKPLRSLFIQAENDLGDLAEMFQGVWLGMNLPGPESPEVIGQVQNSITIRKITTHTGYAFCEALRRLIDLHKPDLVWIDPLLSYIGDDISKQSVCSQFLRNWLNPISEATGVIWMLLHHTGKPPKDPKAKSHWNKGDYAYEGTGSSELTNWARAVCYLHRADENLFELKLAKRGPRARARDLQNNTTTSIWLKHSLLGICWQQCDPPSDDDSAEDPSVAKPREKNESSAGASPSTGKSFDYDAFLDSIQSEHFSASQLVDRAKRYSGLSERTLYARILPELKRRMSFDAGFKTFSFIPQP